MALVGETYVGELEVKLNIIGPLKDAATPTIRLDFELRSNYHEDVTILPFTCQLKTCYLKPDLYLGTSTTFFYISNVGAYTKLKKGSKRTFSSYFQLGYEKLGILMKRVENDVFLTANIYGTLLRKETTELTSLSWGCSISYIKIPASEWTNWLSIWISELKTITISGELWRELYELRKRLGMKNDEELLKELFEHYRSEPR